ncbi:MAG: response regulator [Clostridia bacterium]|nr:response regulator [Clostridia bacterium]
MALIAAGRQVRPGAGPRAAWAARSRAERPGERGRVLAVDDKPYIRQLLATDLGLQGYTVLEAADGFAALAIAEREPLDLVLLDLILPGLDGYEVLRRLRASPATAGLPVLILSARVPPEGEASLAGAQGYLVKPFDLDELERQVARWVAYSRREGPDGLPPGLPD